MIHIVNEVPVEIKKLRGIKYFDLPKTKFGRLLRSRIDHYTISNLIFDQVIRKKLFNQIDRNDLFDGVLNSIVDTIDETDLTIRVKFNNPELIWLGERGYRIDAADELWISNKNGSFITISPSRDGGVYIGGIMSNAKGDGTLLMNYVISKLIHICNKLGVDFYDKLSLECNGTLGDTEIGIENQIKFFSKFGFEVSESNKYFSKLILTENEISEQLY